MRAEYNEQIGVMRGLCGKVAQSAERVRVETENLRIDEAAVRDQEQILLERSEALEKKESMFQDKGRCISGFAYPCATILTWFAVLAVLEKTKHVVQLCDNKREAHNL